MGYKHLTLFLREKILLSISSGLSITLTAMMVGVNKSTVSRELARNGGRKKYSAAEAQSRYSEVRGKSRRKRTLADKELARAVAYLIRDCKWSPEEIIGREGLLGSTTSLSVSTIYRGIKAGMLLPWATPADLRRKGRPYKKKGVYRGKIPGRVPMSQRPAEANARMRLGDFEGDIVVGSGRGACVVTYVDRKSRLLAPGLLSDKRAETVASVSVKTLSGLPVHTITLDNGGEFFNHHIIAEGLGAKLYFAPPGQPWQRGTNENTNGLLREFLPKGMSMEWLTPDKLKQIAEILNNRPRKCLGWLTPSEVFYNLQPTALRLT